MGRTFQSHNLNGQVRQLQRVASRPHDRNGISYQINFPAAYARFFDLKKHEYMVWSILDEDLNDGPTFQLKRVNNPNPANEKEDEPRRKDIDKVIVRKQ